MTSEQRRVSNLHDIGTRRRKDKRLAWVADIGAVERPLRTWVDVATALGARNDEVARLIGFGVVDLLLLRYSRGRTNSVLALKVRSIPVAGIKVTACESADMSAPTRSVHAGQTVTFLASDTSLTMEFPDGETRTVPRTTTQPVRSVKGQRPRSATSS